MLKKLTLISASALSAFAMHTAEININNEDLELAAKFDMGQFNKNVKPNTIFVGGKFLKTNQKDSEFNGYNHRDPYGEINFLMQQEIGNKGISFGMGVKANYTKNYATIPLGVAFGLKIPVKDFIPMSLHASIYYAPDPLCFNDAKDFMEYRVNYDVEVIKNGMVTVGYRQLDTDYDASGYDNIYNNSWYVGFKFSF